jgi:adenylosuccinate synthase
MVWKHIAVVLLSTLMISVACLAPSRASESSSGSEKGLTDKVGETAKKIGKKIEEGFNKTAKKIEDKHVPEKVERKLKKAVDKTAEGFDKAERKIKQKLAE